MSDFIREVDEELRHDQFKRFLNRYWIALLLVVILVLAGVGAWRATQYLSAQRAQAAGGDYLAALDLLKDSKSAEALADLNKVIRDGTPGYRLLARFRLAAETGATDKTAGARMFDGLAVDPAADPAFQNVAKIRAALLLVDSLSYADLQARLAPLADANNILRNSARELLALAALKADKTGEAGRLLDAITTDPAASGGLRQRAGALKGLVRSAGTAAAPAAPVAADPAPAAPPPASSVTPDTPPK